MLPYLFILKTQFGFLQLTVLGFEPANLFCQRWADLLNDALQEVEVVLVDEVLVFHRHEDLQRRLSSTFKVVSK